MEAGANRCFTDSWFISGEMKGVAGTVKPLVGNHYENTRIQYTEIFSTVKIENFIGKSLISLICLLKT